MNHTKATLDATITGSGLDHMARMLIKNTIVLSDTSKFNMSFHTDELFKMVDFLVTTTLLGLTNYGV